MHYGHKPEPIPYIVASKYHVSTNIGCIYSVFLLTLNTKSSCATNALSFNKIF